MTYYTLAEPAPEVGSTLITDPAETYVTADPRTLPVVDITDGRYETATELVQSTSLALIRVEPVGAVTGPDEYRCYTATGGWTLVAVEPSIDAVLGPQAQRIREVVALAEKKLTGCYDTDPVSAGYCDAVNSRYDDTRPHVDAAEAALRAVGADGIYWTGCEYGWELLALAARDLIGTTPGWTQEAYDALTEPWRLAMGLPAHLDDTAPVPAS